MPDQTPHQPLVRQDLLRHGQQTALAGHSPMDHFTASLGNRAYGHNNPLDPCLQMSSSEPRPREPAMPVSGAHHGRHIPPLAPSACQTYDDELQHICESPDSDDSHGSLEHDVVNCRPQRLPDHVDSPLGGTTADFARVSLQLTRDDTASPQSQRGREMLAVPATPNKRSASSDVHQSPAGNAPAVSSQRRATNFVPAKMQKRTPHGPQSSYNRLEQSRASSIQNPQRRIIDHKTQVRSCIQSHARPKEESALPRDSGYGSMNNTATELSTVPVHGYGSNVPTHDPHDAVHHHKGVIQMGQHARYPGLILQPDSSPISLEQLAREVKGIYAGLVMVEAKCINIDAAQAADPKQPLAADQWQALIALHRTLLYEHHDFLMATQHPSATPALRGLPTKHSMPARMWKHGIHAFLEVLRHRRPESQDYMLAFIYLAYQMMALLFETVPAFTDTWIECLGDLARYRMAIEEEREVHSTWGGVAARWYTLASDRHPSIGRLYHHLGILERPSLRKFCLYAKSLTCVIPFGNARGSLGTLCGPLVQEELAGKSLVNSLEARAVTSHALTCSQSDISLIKRAHADVIGMLPKQAPRLRECGAHFAIINISNLFEMGSPTNLLYQQYTTAINQAMQQVRPSMTLSNSPIPYSPDMPHSPPSAHLKVSEDFWAASFNTLVDSFDSSALTDYLPYIHCSLVLVHSLHSLRARLLNGQPLDTYLSPVNTGRLSWNGLALFLNTLAQQEPITHRVLECARQGIFLVPERKENAKPLSEDYIVRGLLWGQFYFSPGWFDGQSEDDGRAIETTDMQTARAQRVLWLGLYLAFHTGHLQYDVHNKVFSSSSSYALTKPSTLLAPEANEYYKEQLSTTTNPTSAASPTVSSSLSSDEGFALVKHPRPTQQISSSPKGQSPKLGAAPYKRHSLQSYAKIAAKPRPVMPPSKQSAKHIKNLNAFQVADDDGRIWTAAGGGAGGGGDTGDW